MQHLRKLTVLGAGSALIVGAVMIPAFAEPTEQTIRESDFIEGAGDTRASGSFEFLEEGIRLVTSDSTSAAKVAEYWPASGSLEGIGAPTYDWFGTANQPGQQIIFDADGIDGNGNDYNILVGEKIYGGDWWLTNGSSQTAKDADPSGANNSGSGSDFFGPMEEWAENLPDARIRAVGFSLGSGLQGDGVLRSQTYGETTYVFSSEEEPVAEPAPTVVDVTGSFEVDKKKKAVKIKFRSDALEDGTVAGAELEWRVNVDGKKVVTIEQGPGETDVFFARFEKKSGKHEVEIVKNGETVRTVKINVR